MLSLVVCGLFAGTYKQVGYIKEKSSDIHKGNRLYGVKLKVKNRNAIYFSDKKGNFTLDGLEKKFSFEEISHKDYVLLDDEDLVMRREASSVPLKIIMVSPKAFREEAKRYYEPMLAEVKKHNIELKIDNEKLLEKLRKKSERLAKVDYDELNEIDKMVRDFLRKGEFHKADSLILSKGSIEERMRYGTKVVKSIVNDFKILSDNALIELDYDKSIKYLENIIAIDPDNIEILLELGNAYCQFKSDVLSGQAYINQAIFFAKRNFKESPTELADCYTYLGDSFTYSRNYVECINALRQALALYNVPNIPEIKENSVMEIDSIHKGVYPILTSKDSSIVNDAYTSAAIIYGLQGHFRLVIDIKQMKNKLINSLDDYEAIVTNYLSDEVLNFQVGLYHKVINDLSEFGNNIDDIDFSDSHAIICYLLGGSYSQTDKIDSAYYYTNKIIKYYKQKKKNYYDQYYIGAWAIQIKTLVREGRYDDALVYTDSLEKEIDLRQVPFQDMISMIYNNKGLSLIGKEEYEKALIELHKSAEILADLNKKGNPITEMNVIVYANLALAYQKTNMNEYAQKYIYKAFSQGQKIFKDIGYEHPTFYVVVDEMYQIELERKLFKEAMETAIYCYKVLDDMKITYRNRIDECYQLAKKNRQYKKEKEYKELIVKYRNFINSYTK